MDMNPGPVSFDDGEHKYWASHIPAERWNGWLSPWFSPLVVMLMVENMNAVEDAVEPPRMSWKCGTTTLVIAWPDGETDEVEPMLIDGELFYAVGQASWMWARV